MVQHNRKEVIKIMRKTKTIVIATAITTLLSATAVFADTTSSNTVQQAPMFSLTHLGEHLGEAHDWLKSRLDSIGFKSRLDSLVTSGTLTQAQEDAIQSAITTATEAGTATVEFKSRDYSGFNTVLDSLVKEGVITQVQKDAI